MGSAEIFCCSSQRLPQEVHPYSYVMGLPFVPLAVYTTPMTIKALIFLVLLSRTPHHRDTETWAERAERLDLVADAISSAALRATCQGPHAPAEGDEECPRLWPGSAKGLAFLLATQALHETHLSSEIHHNRCRLAIGECDARVVRDPQTGTLTYIQQSFSLWQIKRYSDIPDDHWALIERGVPGTHYAAWHAARRLASAYRSCGTLTGAISRYALGGGCEWGGAKERVRTWQRLLSLDPQRLEDQVASKNPEP